MISEIAIQITVSQCYREAVCRVEKRQVARDGGMKRPARHPETTCQPRDINKFLIASSQAREIWRLGWSYLVRFVDLLSRLTFLISLPARAELINGNEKYKYAKYKACSILGMGVPPQQFVVFSFPDL